MLRIAFFCSGALWLVGGFLTRDYNVSNRLNYLRQLQNPDPFMINLNGFFVNICGSITVILGIALLIRWIARRGRVGATPKEEGGRPLPSAPEPTAQVRPTAVEAPPTGQLSANWVGWFRRENELVIEFTFQGSQLAGGETKVQINASIEKGTFQIFRMFNIFVVPRILDEEGYLAIILTSTSSDESTGFIPVRTTPVPGGATLLNVEGREESDKVFKFLCLGKEMEFQIWGKTEPLVKLPLHNDAGFSNLYREIEQDLRSMAGPATG